MDMPGIKWSEAQTINQETGDSHINIKTLQGQVRDAKTPLDNHASAKTLWGQERDTKALCGQTAQFKPS